jgi:cytochrome c biogenesis protein CcmG/thiol:disulfide interchange protein DsbE
VSSPRRLLRWAVPLAVLPVVGLLAYGFRTDPRDIPSPLVGKPAAAFTLTAFDGSEVSLEALRGKVVVLNFWASWCYPACYEEAPALERAWLRYKDRGAAFVGINIQDKEEPARRFLDQFNLRFANAPDPGGRVSVSYGVYGVPETYFIDRQGRIRLKHVGAVPEPLLDEQIERLLAEGS